MAFKPFGLEERAPIPDSVRRDGFKSFGTKGFPGPYYNSAIFEASQDHVLGTQAQVTLGQATCYYASTADFRDKDNAVVTFVAYDRINIVIDQMERDIVFPAVKLEFLAHSQFDMNGFDMSIPGDCSGRLEGTNTSVTVSVITITGQSNLLKIYDDSNLITVDDSAATGKVMINGAFRTEWDSAAAIGVQLNFAGAGVASLTTLSSTDVVFMDANIEVLGVYRFGTNPWQYGACGWSVVGTGLTITGAGVPALATLNSTDIAYIDSSLEKLRVYRWGGVSFSQVGSDLSIPGTAVCDITALNSTDVAFIDNALQSLRMYRFNGTVFSQLGNSLSLAGWGAPAICKLTETDIAILDDSSGFRELRTYRFDGSDFTQVGSSLSISGDVVGGPSMTPLNRTDVIVTSTSRKFLIYRFSGNTWVKLVEFANTGTWGDTSLTTLNGNDVAFFESNGANLRTYRYAESN